MAGDGAIQGEALVGVVCPRCNSALVPISPTDEIEGLAFGCLDGHILSLKELFSLQAKALKAPLLTLIHSWEQAAQQIAEGAQMASVRGFGDVAERLLRRVGALEARVQILRTFLNADPVCPPPPAREI